MIDHTNAPGGRESQRSDARIGEKIEVNAESPLRMDGVDGKLAQFGISEQGVR